MADTFQKALLLVLAMCLADVSFAQTSSAKAREFDFQSYLSNLHEEDCPWIPNPKRVYVNNVSYHDFNHDGRDEAIVRASSCMTGTAGPDIHAVYRIDPSGDVVEFPIEYTSGFEGRPFRFAGNTNWTLRVESGSLVQDYYDGSGREDPVRLFFTFEGNRFQIAKVERAPVYEASFDCARAESPNEVIICGHADLAKADVAMTREYRALLVKLSPAEGTSLRADQRGWLEKRDETCLPYKFDSQGVDCLREIYTKRLEELSHY